MNISDLILRHFKWIFLIWHFGISNEHFLSDISAFQMNIFWSDTSAFQMNISDPILQHLEWIFLIWYFGISNEYFWSDILAFQLNISDLILQHFKCVSVSHHSATPQKKHGCVPVCDGQPGDDHQGRECQVAATFHLRLKSQNIAIWDSFYPGWLRTERWGCVK